MRLYENDDNPREMVSYLTLRKAVGIMGILLPGILAVVCFALGASTGFEDSISDYYGTRARDLFVGILFAIAWFLFAYRGYERQDDIASDLACLFALGVALFPATSENARIRAVHFISATAMFLVLSYFSLALFTKSDGSPTKSKLRRNRLYKTCGAIMLMCIAFISLYYLLLSDTAFAALKPVYWLESLALWSFGLSWLTKGETLWQDAKAG